MLEIICCNFKKNLDYTRLYKTENLKEIISKQLQIHPREIIPAISIFDALDGISGVVCVQDANWVEGNPSRREPYARRDKSSLTPIEFFNQLFPQAEENVELEAHTAEK